ncbi:protein-glutamate methylesterase/protein-glutamine glutaminase [Chitinimonas lacunae]|uniref:Protein-glutamate methylesterase/protein-glutamine glutaminase n=1 Tax=Chitinimonas lacunae TaxID=1963018 RepID=A0ABV8MNH2_9NEIS
MSIKVLIVDDSAVVREVLRESLSTLAGIKVIGTASDPLFAMQLMNKQWPDVIVLDIEMPRMDGLTFLRKLMAERPTPVVICSSLSEAGAAVTLDALASGAVSVVTKPAVGAQTYLQQSIRELAQQIRAAASAKLVRIKGRKAENEEKEIPPKLTADAVLEAPTGQAVIKTTARIAVIGTSTGGTQALEYLLPRLPRTCCGMAIVQHMPEKFTATFAERLNQLCKIEVREARSGDRLLPGVALIAPGGRHLLVKRSGAQYLVDIKDGPPVSRHRPSVDVLFRSAAVSAGSNAVGVIMTGMGDDGARGMKEMHDAGAYTIAQDEASSLVYGMPKEAVARGGVDVQMSLVEIAKALAKT